MSSVRPRAVERLPKPQLASDETSRHDETCRISDLNSPQSPKEQILRQGRCCQQAASAFVVVMAPR